jgi:hypothetical protein
MPKAPVYDQRMSAYRGADGRLVSRATIIKLIDEETARMETRLRGHALEYISGNISLSEMQRRMAYDIKLSHIRMAAFASGGINELDDDLVDLVSTLLLSQYSYLDRFGRQIEEEVRDKPLTGAQIVARAALYGTGARVAFFIAEKVTKIKTRFNQARRTLDPQAQHCEDCIRHATRGWRPIAEVVPPGIACRCRQRCKCSISYRRYY